MLKDGKPNSKTDIDFTNTIVGGDYDVDIFSRSVEELKIGKPKGSYYFDEEAGLWVTDGTNDNSHFYWWSLNKRNISKKMHDGLSEEDSIDLAYDYAAEYLAF